MAMPRYKLTYFDFRGRVDLIRLLFVAGGIDFEDVRVSFQEWTDLKEKIPCGRLPILEFDEIILSESRAIARYVAKKTNQYGKDILEQAHVDMITDVTDDLTLGMLKAYCQKNESDRDEMMKTHFDQGCLKTLFLLERLLLDNNGGDGYFVGEEITMADLHFYVLSEPVLTKNPSCLKDTPTLAALLKRIEENPRISEWLPKRPEKFSAVL